MQLPQPTAVPDLTGLTESRARALLGRVSLAVGEVRRAEAEAEPGTVIRQEPAPRTEVAAGSKVSFTLAIPVTTPVPDLVGRLESEARDLLRRARLSAGTVSTEESRAPRGQVIAQKTPPGERLALGSTVDFVVAVPVTVTMPALVGRAEAEARRLIQEAGLAVGSVVQTESRRASGTVLTQGVQPNRRVIIGTPIDMVVAIPVMVTVPRLVGRSRQEAIGLLEGVELVAGEVTREESRQPVGTVLSQRPAADERIAVGSAVAMVTARPVTVQVPDLVSLGDDAARRALAGAELQVGAVRTEESRRPAGSVLRQGVAAGTRVDVGTRIDLVVAAPVTVLVPEVVGRGEAEARQRLTAAELRVGSLQHQESAARPGTVLAQGLNPNSRVAVGTEVGLVVAVVETVAVPDVIGLPVQEARRALVVGRLEVGGEETRASRDDEEGTVLEQSWEAGKRAAVGTAVDLIVATPAMVVVPEVVGLSHEAAVEAITGAGLPVGEVGRKVSLSAGGTVLAQAQAAGSSIRFDTPVALQEALPRVVWIGPIAFLLLVTIAGITMVRRRSPRSSPPVPPPAPRRAKGGRAAGDETAHIDELDLGPADDDGDETVRGPEIDIGPAAATTRGPTLLADLEVHAAADSGEQRLEWRAASPIGLEINLKPVADKGRQKLSATGDLVAGEWRDDDRNRG